MAAAALVVTAVLSQALAAPATQGSQAEARALQGFLDRASPACQRRPAKACVDLGWRFAARSPDKGLTVDDLRQLRRHLGAWYDWRRPALSAHDRGTIVLGLLLADGLGVERLHAGFDTNRDGRVSRAELLADVALDQRPLGDVLADPKAVDRAALSRRLGLPETLIAGLFR